MLVLTAKGRLARGRQVLGTTALIVFLGSLGMGFLCLVMLAYSSLRIYRTVRYAYKDYQPWAALFREYAETLAGTARLMEERVRDISETGREIRETVEDMQDAIEELRSHPMLHAARLAGRFRS
jgi:hypothetical protein